MSVNESSPYTLLLCWLFLIKKECTFFPPLHMVSGSCGIKQVFLRTFYFIMRYVSSSFFLFSKIPQVGFPLVVRRSMMPEGNSLSKKCVTVGTGQLEGLNL